MEGQVGRFRKKVPFLFPFTPVSQLRSWSEKGTKIRKWQENAQTAERKGGKPEVFLPCRGTNFEIISKNAYDSLQETENRSLSPFYVQDGPEERCTGFQYVFFVLDISGKPDIFILSVFS